MILYDWRNLGQCAVWWFIDVSKGTWWPLILRTWLGWETRDRSGKSQGFDVNSWNCRENPVLLENFDRKWLTVGFASHSRHCEGITLLCPYAEAFTWQSLHTCNMVLSDICYLLLLLDVTGMSGNLCCLKTGELRKNFAPVTLQGHGLCHLQGHTGSKTLLQRNPPVLKWRCRLMQVNLCWLVGWSLTSHFSTNMAISETRLTFVMAVKWW